MKKCVFASVMFALATSQVAAADAGLYAGVSLGYANIDPPSTFGSAKDDSDTVVGGIAGYQFNDMFGVEVQYTGAGKFRTATASGKADMLSLSGVATLPLSDAFGLYGKLGIAEAYGNGTGTARDEDRTAATFGLGMKYSLSRNFDARLGWDRYKASLRNTASSHDYDSDVWSVAAIYKF